MAFLTLRVTHLYENWHQPLSELYLLVSEAYLEKFYVHESGDDDGMNLELFQDDEPGLEHLVPKPGFQPEDFDEGLTLASLNLGGTASWYTPFPQPYGS